MKIKECELRMHQLNVLRETIVNYVYLRMHAKNLFQTLELDKPQERDLYHSSNFGPTVAQNYAGSYLRICFKEPLQYLKHDMATFRPNG